MRTLLGKRYCRGTASEPHGMAPGTCSDQAALALLRRLRLRSYSPSLHHAFIKRTQLILTVETGVISHVKRRYLQTGFLRRVFRRKPQIRPRSALAAGNLRTTTVHHVFAR